MNAPDPAAVRGAILAELESRGFPLGEAEHEVDLVGAGVNSAALIQLLSALEDEFELFLDTERLFSRPVTVARLEAEIAHAAAVE